LERAFGKPTTYFSIKELIKPLTIKGLIIHDKGDDVCVFVDAENIHTNWQGSELIATEGYGHRLQNEKVNNMIVDYLKKETDYEDR
jgi:predicted alpha/beta hydrolase family esterase